MNYYLPFIEFNRDDWASLLDETYVPLSEAELQRLKGVNEKISIQEVEDIYIPLTRLLHLYVNAYQELQQQNNQYLGSRAKKSPYIIGIAGSVAVGKSTTARLLQTLLSRLSNRPNVSLVTTDGFLYPNEILEKKGIMNRKGFPESYDRRKLLQFISDVKAGKPAVKAPIYSHLEYDILPDQFEVVDNPDILIFEGLNVLQTNRSDRVFVSDFFDFSIYVDADQENIKRWYIERFLLLRDTAFRDPDSYFRVYANISEEEAIEKASQVWKEINEVNLYRNILPTRGRAKMILRKGPHHHMEKIYLRNL
ncbi:type I pantothenate kinase [Ammoniphilus oxalaticus]|uniref:Pantothenate kinase n=1 Tax=Ammoniphilus oxalaticus TaxID=66863 RepID=A0A419SLT8_9BACL|nr:type I pantothenate kinase [Ammoniphilus oxalaticus]RKD25053.1 type I pantothenate kinase [Ammoniphilus oxalaticus]